MFRKGSVLLLDVCLKLHSSRLTLSLRENGHSKVIQNGLIIQDVYIRTDRHYCRIVRRYESK